MGRHPRPGCATGVGFLALVLSTAICAAGVALAGIPSVGDAAAPSTRTCWVFNHMNKSGGTSIKQYVKKWRRGRGYRLYLFDTQEWTDGVKESTERYLQQNNTITMGGYAEALRPYGAQDCKWFTIFRHPISRLVSAYYYCKVHRSDQLCATRARNRADSNDLVGFARHWGNHGLQQFVLGFVKAEDIVPQDEEAWAATAATGHACLRPFERGNIAEGGCPGWYLLKLFVERRSACIGQASAGGDSECEESTMPYSLNQEWMHRFLQPVMDILSEKYAAVGLLERWNASMRLFQATLEMPGMDWLGAFETTGRANALSHSQLERQETLREAWDDPEIRGLVWLDLVLYDHAVTVFNKQAERTPLSGRLPKRLVFGGSGGGEKPPVSGCPKQNRQAFLTDGIKAFRATLSSTADISCAFGVPRLPLAEAAKKGRSGI
eukprot:g11192.t1